MPALAITSAPDDSVHNKLYELGRILSELESSPISEPVVVWSESAIPPTIAPIYLKVVKAGRSWDAIELSSESQQSQDDPARRGRLSEVSFNRALLVHVELHGLPEIEQNTRLQQLSDEAYALFESLIPPGSTFLRNVTKSVIATLVGEMSTNVLEHAFASHACMALQYWPAPDIGEICLIDDGQGIFKSLLSAGRQVTSNENALQRVVNEHLSAKDEYGLVTRGYGILTARRLLVNRQVRGEFALLTGNTLFEDAYLTGARFWSFQKFNWQGTLVYMKLRNPTNRIRYSDYVY